MFIWRSDTDVHSNVISFPTEKQNRYLDFLSQSAFLGWPIKTFTSPKYEQKNILTAVATA